MFPEFIEDKFVKVVASPKHTMFGVKSGIPIILAKNKLKEQIDAVFLPVDFDYYSDISSKAMEIIETYADVFEYVGRDEAYLDVTKKTELDFSFLKKKAIIKMPSTLT